MAGYSAYFAPGDGVVSKVEIMARESLAHVLVDRIDAGRTVYRQPGTIGTIERVDDHPTRGVVVRFDGPWFARVSASDLRMFGLSS